MAKASLRAVAAKPAEPPPPPFRYDASVAPYYAPELAAKWRSAVAWLRREPESKWILDVVQERESS